MFIDTIPSIWLGQGTINMRNVSETLRFFTRWTIGEEEIIQEVEIMGIPIKQTNLYQRDEKLIITLENEEIGCWSGEGRIEGHHLSWELFSGDKTLSSEEHFYHLENGRIKTRAIFKDKDGPYTVATGEIWKKLA